MMNGKPFQVNGKYPAFLRANTSGDARSNLHVSGQMQKAQIDDNALPIAKMVRSKPVADEIFPVGLDTVGDKLMVN